MTSLVKNDLINRLIIEIGNLDERALYFEGFAINVFSQPSTFL